MRAEDSTSNCGRGLIVLGVVVGLLVGCTELGLCEVGDAVDGENDGDVD